MLLCVGFTLPAPGPGNPDMRFRDWTDRATLNQLNHPMIILIGMNLDAHLRGHFGLGGCFPDLARFPNVMREWFLTINMLAAFQGEHGGKRMCVLAGAD